MKPKQIALILCCLLAPLTVYAQDAKNAVNEQFFEAVKKGDLATVTRLLDQGVDVNTKFRYGATALFKAAERGHTEVVKLLLARGADATVRDSFYGATAMTWALDSKHVEVVRALLTKDTASVDSVLTTGVTGGHIELVNVALAQGGVTAETLTAALAGAMADPEKAAIAEALKKAGAQPPMEVEASMLATYAGVYKPPEGADLTVNVKEGKLFAHFGGQPYLLMALDKSTFRPVAFTGVVINFKKEGEKVTGFTLKQGTRTTEFIRIGATN